MNKSTPPAAIRLTRTPEVARALALAKKRYPTLSDPEILKVGLANLTTALSENDNAEEVQRMAAYSFNLDGYLDDPEEDIYHLGMGKKVNY